MNDLDTGALRAAFGAFLTGVTVVTARGRGGAPVGFTANSFTSVSLDPPLLLVCPARTLSSYPVFRACAHFAVSVLAQHQDDVSTIFARSTGDRFAQVDWIADAHGCPLIAGAAAHFACAAHARVDAGDHDVLLGRVEAFHASGAAGLGFANGRYLRSASAPCSVTPIRRAASGDRPPLPDAIRGRKGRRHAAGAGPRRRTTR